MTDQPSLPDFQPWIKRFPGRMKTAGQDESDSGTGIGGATVVFPHAGGAAAAYRTLALALSAHGADTYVVQYPRRADRLAHPAAETIGDLAAELFEAGDWQRIGPLRLFGHCMGALVAFEFARIAERHGLAVTGVWASAGQAPSTVQTSPPAPTTDRELLADIVDLGGTDARLLDDEDFLELLLPAVRADYQAFNRYACGRDVRIRADIHTVGGRHDHRVSPELLQRWEIHTDSVFTLTLFDGGHFFIDDHVDVVAELVSAS